MAKPAAKKTKGKTQPSMISTVRNKVVARPLIAGLFVLLFAIGGYFTYVALHAEVVPAHIVGIGGKCLDNKGNILAEGNTVQIFTCSTSTAQQWAVSGFGTPGTIINANGYCMTASGTGLRAPVTINKCTGSDLQKWTYDSTTHAIVNAASQLCLAASDWTGNDRTITWVYTCTGHDPEQWTADDATPPTITVATPISGATVAGTVKLSASTSDNVGVTKVEYYVNGKIVSTLTTAPYTFAWSTAALANGTYTITAKAYDAAGNVGTTTAPTTVTVKNIVATPPPPPPTATTLLSSNFDTMPTSAPISLTNYRAAMGDSTVGGTTAIAHTSIVSAAGHGNVLRQVLPANMSGGGSGLVTFPKLSKTIDEASIQYDIRFDSTFDWSAGGKLPGLGGAIPGVNPSIATGCNTGTNTAWSGRSMWITPKSYGSVTGANEWIGYMYNYHKVDACGDNIRTGKVFGRGTWHTIKQYYKMNTPGKNDGVHKMWFDGTLVVNNTAFAYRNTNTLHINVIDWAVFRGGSTALWESPASHYIDFDNLTVTTP